MDQDHLPGKVVYGQLAFVNKRFQSLALKSEVLRTINASYMSKNSFKSLKQLTMPIQILCQFSLHQDVVKAIKVTKNLKSLVFKNDWFDTYDDGIAKVQRGQTIYDMGIIQALKKSKSKLEHLSLTGYYVEPVLMIELAKVKTLKTFRISDARRVVITPEVVNTFAKSENQLESIEFDDTNGEYYDPDFSFDDGNDTDELNEALNNLLEKKSKTLKSLKYITWDGYCDSEVPLTNLELCLNLEEFCGQLQHHDLEVLAKLPKLQKLRLNNLDEPKYLFIYLNLHSLRYLALKGCDDKATKNICQEIPKQQFPALERLFINDPPKLNEKFFSSLTSNAPKLRSIQLNESQCPVSDQFMYNFCKNSDIFVSFSSKDFEDFLLELDLIVFGKYNRMKRIFESWSLDNPDYCK